MAKNQCYGVEFKTPPGTVYHSHVFKKHKFESDEGEGKFRMMLAWEKTSKEGKLVKKLFTEQVAAAIEDGIANHPEWNGKAPITKKMVEQLKDGDEADSEIYPFLEGKWYITPSSQFKPAVVDADRADLHDDDDFYNGCIARALVNLKAYVFGTKKDLSLYLNGVQKLADGERIVSERSNADVADKFDDDVTVARKSAKKAKDEDDFEEEKPAKKTSAKKAPAEEEDDDDW